MSTNVKYGAPSASMQGSFTAPESFGNTKTKLKVEPIPQGLHMCTIFGVVGTGTHMHSFQGSPEKPRTEIFLWYELPQFKRKFYEEDTEMRSAAIMDEMTLMTHGDKAKLKKIIDAVCQRKLTDDEGKAFSLDKLLGCSMMINVEHYQKKDGTIGEKASMYATTVGMPVPIGYAPENERVFFYIDEQLNNFRTENFANLPGFLRKKLIESQEGQRFIASGGIFAKLEQSQQPQGVGTTTHNAAPVPAPAPSPAPAVGGELQMLVNDYTRQQYNAVGWTDQMLVDGGKAKWVQPAAPVASPTPPPAPAAPTPPPAPSAPPIPQAAATQVQNTPAPTHAQNWLDEEDDDMPF